MTVIVGAYPTYGSPTSPSAATLVRLLAESPLVASLEVPFVDGEVALPATGVPGPWRHVVTLMPATMAGVAADTRWGPASNDADGRAAALALYRSVRATLSRRHDITAVELQTAPARTGSAVVFADVLAEVASWDWNGVEIVVEHCDAWTTAHPVEKGFLSQADELDAIAAVAARTSVTAGVNWARSVIETRDVATGADHVRAAAARGLLGALMFSSVSEEATELGAAWRDVHLAPAGTEGAPAGSLLTPELVAETRQAAGAYEGILGLKINLGPTVPSPEVQAARLLAIAALVAG